MELLRETLPDRGLAVRIVVDDAADSYRVEYTPLSGGSVTDEWTVFGGSVGYDASVFASDAVARAMGSESTFRLSHRMRCLTRIQPLCGRR
ncbi:MULTISPECIES: hypothetical protein [unclassified Haloferax]|uniref:hypothetical protein n=1 Tax=Haloferax TaxID=2251 RepID=UPI001267517C